ncbi:Hpt domain-containing protein [Mangrovimonas aestuarii]|uniref:Hpt domain-containing protein n=1 Tax=Mangrovimonas aestuarii TaxID=3018443 RepID=UPI00237860F0|nr:Hpt domain-containing protein [Mangrovimonas aestuarii]
MEEHYKLYRVRDLADGDEDFIMALAQTFLEEIPEDAQILKEAVAKKDYNTSYKTAHKMKPTIDMFELGVMDELIIVQDWGKFEKTGEDVSEQLDVVLTAIENASNEIRSDFNL